MDEVNVTKPLSWKIKLLTGVLGFFGGQNWWVLLPITALLTYFFIYRRYKEKGKDVFKYYFIGVLISLATTLLFASIAYVYISSLF